MPEAAPTYSAGEPGRLARPVLALARSGLYGTEDWQAWFMALPPRIGDPELAYADEGWLAMGRVRAPRPLTMQAVGRWSDGTFRHCVTLQYDWRGEWQTAPAGPAPRAD